MKILCRWYKEKPCRITPHDFKSCCFWTAQNITRVGYAAALQMLLGRNRRCYRVWAVMPHLLMWQEETRVLARYWWLGRGQSRCPQCEASDKPSLLFPSSPHGPPSQLPSLPALTMGSFALPRPHGEKSECNFRAGKAKTWAEHSQGWTCKYSCFWGVLWEDICTCENAWYPDKDNFQRFLSFCMLMHC